ncbi:MAG: bifunctional glutamate N-acetyltransferase/amino-acid acetyltransferase ArgJ [Dethiobacteria bacterium]|jgi:glutamate N-acetyltransferase/amino-acid N-acetyltransferase|nr:bifunctional glutamate N-acetyltransferase/amino-acid acetyltransferase ArgJ [Bacillota bacterium]HOP69767.1 bifunctional glutamate N-acetyltransferase/amino-acid acetyltransferase ArgJ [Bacillota bacterium]HPT34668.1 bifunctional glutamate N-acetyltransferase/amino-acid acetyltransferase ArgJ [Bacillota bacterium]HQD07033.1 bifunctional glutamate N-acetyltransferase/amino-acid acetyltransferase ArgJ [Bacillota bacterium]
MQTGNWEKIEDGGITAVAGIKAAGVHCGLKKEQKDLAVIYSAYPAAAAGAFTRNLVQAAPVQLCRRHLDQSVQALVVNSGNANACTGRQGWENALEMAGLAAEALKLSPEQVLVCSTGVIGRQLPMEKIRAGIKAAVSALSSGEEGALDAAEAIMTTDTTIKQVAYRGILPGGEFHLAGMAKGAGMICPDMATMLAFLFTDLSLPADLLRRLFRQAVDRSFNLITIDGDTSTNDTALILANGASGVEILPGGPEERLFAAMLEQACRELALKIVQDGEGVTKVIELTINGAPDGPSARKLARSVLNSPLVKTAFYGEDANWGRIMAALGYAGVEFDPRRVDIYLGPVQVAAAGEALPFSEKEAKKVLSQNLVPVRVELNSGEEQLTAWGTDLSHEYVSINSDYRS